MARAARLALAACLAVPQQDQTVSRIEKGDYSPALREYRAAEAMIDDDPRGAAEKLDAVIGNPKIRKVECRIRIEERPAEYGEWMLFLPYQLRGRARLNLARRSSGDAAERMFSGAVEDFQKSVEAGIRSSEELLRVAREELERLKAAPRLMEDSLERFTQAFQRLLRQNRFKSARALLDGEGRGLPDARREAFAAECERRCRQHLAEQSDEFRRRLARLSTTRDLREMSDAAFMALFELPPPDEMLSPDPVCVWARAHARAFAEVRAGRAGGEALLAAAAAAAALDQEGPNPWFAAVENLAFQGIREGVRSAVEGAADAPKAERDALRARADGLLGLWRNFVDGLGTGFLERHAFVTDHSAQLAAAVGGFPAEPAELERLDFDACFAAGDPLAELGRLERRLREMEEGGQTMARESRRKLYAAIVTASALRLLAEGSSESDVVRRLGEYGAKLKRLGDPVEAREFGPRVERIFRELLK